MNLKQLISLSDLLDKNGFSKEADQIDEYTKKLATHHEEEEVMRTKSMDPEEATEIFNKELEEIGISPEMLKTLLQQKLESGEKGLILHRNPETDEWGEPEEYTGTDTDVDIKKDSRKIVFEKLAEVADELDTIGEREAANKVDAFMQKYSGDEEAYDAEHRAYKELSAIIKEYVDKNGFEGVHEALEILASQFFHMGRKLESQSNKQDRYAKTADSNWDEYRQEEADTEQSKRYDSKYHHSLQVREPKKDQERVDREGRKTHHVHSQQKVEAYSLSTRYCPEHQGVTMGRVGEGTYQCPLDHQTYNWETGWTDYDGNQHPGGSVAGQTPDSSGYAIPHRIFDSREQILNRVT